MKARLNIGVGLSLALSMVALGCSANKTTVDKDAVAKLLRENPDILVEAIAANPAPIALAMQKANKESREQLAKLRIEEEREAREKAIDQPLHPDLPEGKAFRGNKDAPLILVEYSDFECPYCGRGAKTVQELSEKYKGQMKFVMKHLPLPMHPHAKLAATYFEAIAAQDFEKAYQFHDELFANQSGLKDGEVFLKRCAEKVGVDLRRLAKDLQSEAVAKRIEADTEEARKFDFTGTPAFLINGVPLKGARPIADFEDTIELLKKKGKLNI